MMVMNLPCYRQYRVVKPLVITNFQPKSSTASTHSNRRGSNMLGGLGPLEIIVLLVIFFVLFGADRLPKMANALGRSKGEFQKGLDESTKAMKLEQTIQDMDAGGRTPSQALAARAKAVGIDPTDMDPDELEKKVAALEKLAAEE